MNKQDISIRLKNLITQFLRIKHLVSLMFVMILIDIEINRFLYSFGPQCPDAILCGSSSQSPGGTSGNQMLHRQKML